MKLLINTNKANVFTNRSRKMNELERTALNEILRTVTYIAEKVDELDSKISQSEEDVKSNASSAS